jgi:hypothetical protein
LVLEVVIEIEGAAGPAPAGDAGGKPGIGNAFAVTDEAAEAAGTLCALAADCGGGGVA